MIWLKTLFTGNGIFASILFGLVAFVAWSGLQRSIGALNASARLEAQNATAASRAQRAARASRNPTARGVSDPYRRAQ